MKLISFVIPCYNSESYMEHAIQSILVAKEDIELIIVNDGSKDNTLKIAREYEKKYPKVVKVIDKENGGHGSGVNAGLDVATGRYFKVVDSDDWVDEESLKKVIKTLKKIDIDMMASLQQIIKVTFGSDIAASVSGVSVATGKVDVYSVSGVLVRKQVEAASALNGLQRGIYIVGGRKVIKR